MSRISELISQLRGHYGNGEMSVEGCKKILQQIQSSIQRKDEEMAWVDSCCLQLVAKTKGGKGEEITYTFQTEGPSVKREWTTELRLAQLALDPNNSPAWEVPEQEQRPSTKMPLFVKSQPVYRSQHQTEVSCITKMLKFKLIFFFSLRSAVAVFTLQIIVEGYTQEREKQVDTDTKIIFGYVLRTEPVAT